MAFQQTRAALIAARRGTADRQVSQYMGRVRADARAGTLDAQAHRGAGSAVFGPVPGKPDLFSTDG